MVKNEEFEDEVEEDDIDEELEEGTKEVKEEKKTKKVVKGKPVVDNEPQERYVAFHVPEITGIRDTITGEEIHDFSDKGSAAAFAKLLNQQDKIMTGAGY